MEVLLLWSPFCKLTSSEMGEHLDFFLVEYHPICPGFFAVVFSYHPSTVLILLIATVPHKFLEISVDVVSYAISGKYQVSLTNFYLLDLNSQFKEEIKCSVCSSEIFINSKIQQVRVGAAAYAVVGMYCKSHCVSLLNMVSAYKCWA